MSKPLVVTGIVAILIGVLAGFLFWGLPSSRLQAELQGAQTAADDLRAQSQQLESQLKAEKSQREALEGDLRREREQSARLQALIGAGKK